MTLGRREAVAAARTALEALDLELRARDVLLGDSALTPLTPLAAHLAQRLADLLQGAAPPSPREALRSAAATLQQRMTDAIRSAPLPAPQGDRRALFVPRRPSHVRDLARVQAAAERRAALDVAWLVFRRDHAAELSPSLYAPALAPWAGLAPSRRWPGLAAALMAWRPAVEPTAKGAIVRELLLQLPSAEQAARALAVALERVRPAVVVVGNPNTTEGAIAAALARARSVPVATLQHGELSAAQDEWARAPFDVMTVWGEVPRARLIALGVDADRVVVTGAPWADALGVRAPSPRSGGAGLRVMAALSGAGHAVGLEEHRAHVAAIARAAALGPRHRWTLRLHPKDDPALWSSALAQHPPCSAVIAHGPGLPPIDEALADHDALVTVQSAAALDAMLRDVAVVTLGRPAGEPVPGFVEAGATVHVPHGAPLLDAIDRLADAGLDGERRARAHAYIAAYFGPRDGQAADRVVDVLLKFCRR